MAFHDGAMMLTLILFSFLVYLLTFYSTTEIASATGTWTVSIGANSGATAGYGIAMGAFGTFVVFMIFIFIKFVRLDGFP